jgi:hypothetical protein
LSWISNIRIGLNMDLFLMSCVDVRTMYSDCRRTALGITYWNRSVDSSKWGTSSQQIARPGE